MSSTPATAQAELEALVVKRYGEYSAAVSGVFANPYLDPRIALHAVAIDPIYQTVLNAANASRASKTIELGGKIKDVTVDVKLGSSTATVKSCLDTSDLIDYKVLAGGVDKAGLPIVTKKVAITTPSASRSTRFTVTMSLANGTWMAATATGKPGTC